MSNAGVLSRVIKPVTMIKVDWLDMLPGRCTTCNKDCNLRNALGNHYNQLLDYLGKAQPQKLVKATAVRVEEHVIPQVKLVPSYTMPSSSMPGLAYAKPAHNTSVFFWMSMAALIFWFMVIVGALVLYVRPSGVAVETVNNSTEMSCQTDEVVCVTAAEHEADAKLISDLRNQLKKAQTDLQSTQTALQDTQSELSKVTAQLQAATEKVEILQQKVDTVNQVNDQLSVELETVKDSHDKHLIEHKVVVKDRDELSAYLATAKVDAGKAAAKIVRITADNEEYYNRSVFAEAESAGKSAHIASLNGDLDTSRDQLEQVKVERDTCLRENAALKIELKDSQSAALIADKIAANTAAEQIAKIDDLESQLRESAVAAASTEQQLETAHNELSAVKAEITIVKAHSEELQIVSTQAKDQLAALQVKYDALDEGLKASNIANKQLGQQVAETEESHDALATLNTELQAEVAQKNTSIVQLEGRNAQLEQVNTERQVKLQEAAQLLQQLITITNAQQAIIKRAQDKMDILIDRDDRRQHLIIYLRTRQRPQEQLPCTRAHLEDEYTSGPKGHKRQRLSTSE